MNYQQLYSEICKKRSFLCVGLDTDYNKIPAHFRQMHQSLFEFNMQIINATASYTVAYKINTAFYECYGKSGWDDLELTLAYIKHNYPEIFVIADAKRGDIGNTSEQYAKAFLEDRPKKPAYDALTVAPYMGSDSVKPFIKYPDKWVILLALTSNPGAFDFQFFENKEGKKLYEQVLETSKSWGTHENMMYVVGATKAQELENIRKIIPEHFLLVPGIGAQGGSLAEVAKYGMNKHCGLLVNSSRAIIYASSGKDFAQKAAEEAKKVRDEMDALLA